MLFFFLPLDILDFHFEVLQAGFRFVTLLALLALVFGFPRLVFGVSWIVFCVGDAVTDFVTGSLTRVES
jgi:hypothetical protein